MKLFRNALLFSALLPVLLLSLAGCSLLATDGNEAPDDGLVRGTGQVVFLEIEGGHFVIQAEDGTRYVPQDLASPLQRDGLRVRFALRTRDDVAHICACGTVVEVVEIDAL